MIRRYKKPTVQLTSLLDLLFCMIFVSLLQTKAPVSKDEKPKEVENKEVTKVAPVKVEKQEQQTLPINAIFHFYKTSKNPDLPTGTYAMNGSFDQNTKSIKLGGVSWINRPAGYDMVPLNGIISEDGFKLTGRIEFQDCQTFTLVRTSKISGSPIAGKWEGVYDCLQGETGLTLTIQ
jgi:hypothetical protein